MLLPKKNCCQCVIVCFSYLLLKETTFSRYSYIRHLLSLFNFTFLSFFFFFVEHICYLYLPYLILSFFFLTLGFLLIQRNDNQSFFLIICVCLNLKKKNKTKRDSLSFFVLVRVCVCVYSESVLFQNMNTPPSISLFFSFQLLLL